MEKEGCKNRVVEVLSGMKVEELNSVVIEGLGDVHIVEEVLSGMVLEGVSGMVI